MSTKKMYPFFAGFDFDTSTINFYGLVFDSSGFLTTYYGFPVMTGVSTPDQFRQKIADEAVAIAIAGGVTDFVESDIVWDFGGTLSLQEALKLKAGTPLVARSQSFPSHSLNSAFQISTTRDAMVSYSVEISATLSLTTGQKGSVYLEIADDSGFTTNVHEVARAVNGNSGTLAIGLGLTQTILSPVSGYVPAGKYVRLRTNNDTGTPTFTYRSGSETLL